MTTPTTNLTMSSIQTEFGGANPISMSEYYRGGVYVPSGTATSATDGVAISTSGTIRMGMFRGVTAVVTGIAPSTTSGVWSCEAGVLAPASATVVILLYADGTGLGDSGVGFTDSPYNWYNPTTPTIGNSYWVRATQTASSGGTLSGSLNSWLYMNTTRSWSLTTSTTGSFSRTLTFEFSTSSTGTPIVASHTNNVMLVTREV